LIGLTVAQLQRVEATVAACWFLYARRQHEPVDEIVLEGDFEKLNARNSKKVLGRFLADIIASGQFQPSIEKRFARFVDRRNRLIHRIFKERAYHNIHNRKTLQKLHRFISQLIKDAFYFESIFDAYLGMSYQLLAKHPANEFQEPSALHKLMVVKEKSGDLDHLRKAMRSVYKWDGRTRPCSVRLQAAAAEG